MRQIEELEAENAWLKDRIKELTGSDVQVLKMQRAVRVSPQSARLLSCLFISDGPVSHRAIWSNVFEHDNGDMPENKIKDVVVCNIRRRLRQAEAPDGLKTVWGKGYELTPALRAWIAERIEE